VLTLRRDVPTGKRNALTFKWLAGPATTAAEYGSPDLGTTTYALCAYVGSSGNTPTLSFAAVAPAGGTCRRGRPCWAWKHARVLLYNDADRTPNGLRRVLLKPGASGKAKVIVVGRGVNLPIPALPFASDASVTVQVVNSDGGCWEATLLPPARVNRADKFTARRRP